MKSSIAIVSVALCAFGSSAFAFDAKLADKSWDGVAVPAGQQCQKFGGNNPATPKIMVSGIPAGSNTLVLEYSDRDSQPMNNGGHGMMSYKFAPAATEVEIPSVAGHTFDMPASFTMINAHRSPNWDKAGAYMPPCSGGKSHAYYVTVKALDGDKVTATTVLELGKY